MAEVKGRVVAAWCHAEVPRLFCGWVDFPPFIPHNVPGLLVVVYHRLNETALQLFQGHVTRLCRYLRVMDAIAGVGQATLKTLRHPTEKIFYGSFCGWSVRRGLLGNDTESIHQDLPCALKPVKILPRS